jgi:tetratricopeptide (TPR) repeat protein
MSTTLNLVEHLLSRGRNFQYLGRDHDAQQTLHRLSSLRDIPAEVHEETLCRLAEMLLRQGRYTKARRHLTALLVQCPDNARYQYMMATAYDLDERADPHRAAQHYRRSLELDPNQPRCHSELGLLALRLGQTEDGLQHLRRAVELAPHDPDAVRDLAEGLRLEGQDDAARDALRAGRFRNPRDPRFLKLWNDFHFRLLHETQQSREESTPAEGGLCRPHILPFLRPTREEHSDEAVVRLDAPTLPQPPHVAQTNRVSGKRHA